MAERGEDGEGPAGDAEVLLRFVQVRFVPSAARHQVSERADGRPISPIPRRSAVARCRNMRALNTAISAALTASLVCGCGDGQPVDRSSGSSGLSTADSKLTCTDSIE